MTKTLRQCTGDEIIEALTIIRHNETAKGNLVQRVAVNPGDWAVVEPKLIAFCEANLVRGVPVWNALPSLLGMAIYVTDDIEPNQLNIGPWQPQEIARRILTSRRHK